MHCILATILYTNAGCEPRLQPDLLDELHRLRRGGHRRGMIEEKNRIIDY